MIQLDRQKYLQIAQTEGVAAALTALHHDYREIEFESFEGKAGWTPELWQDLELLRTFSRELWGMDLAKNFYQDAEIRKPGE